MQPAVEQKTPERDADWMEAVFHTHHPLVFRVAYRVTGNAGVHLEESRRLTDDEIEKVLLQVEKLGEEIEERPPNDDESEIIHRIQTLHPEVRYIIQSFHKVEAAPADEDGPGYKVKYKDIYLKYGRNLASGISL